LEELGFDNEESLLQMNGNDLQTAGVKKGHIKLCLGFLITNPFSLKEAGGATMVRDDGEEEYKMREEDVEEVMERGKDRIRRELTRQGGDIERTVTTLFSDTMFSTSPINKRRRK